MRDAVPLHWHLARWRAEAPGARGLVWLGLITALLLVPVERLGAALAWSTQAQVLINLGVTLAAIAFGRATGLPDEAERWLVLRGFTPADWSLARWTANLLPLTALAALWALVIGVVSAALHGSGVAWSGVLGVFVHLTLTAAVLTLVLMALGASGTAHTAEGLLLVLIITLVMPVAGERLPTVLADGLRLALPPLDAIAAVRDAALHQRWTPLLHATLRLGTWSATLVAVSALAANRRVPERTPRAPVPRR